MTPAHVAALRAQVVNSRVEDGRTVYVFTCRAENPRNYRPTTEDGCPLFLNAATGQLLNDFVLPHPKNNGWRKSELSEEELVEKRKYGRLWTQERDIKARHTHKSSLAKERQRRRACEFNGQAPGDAFTNTSLTSTRRHTSFDTAMSPEKKAE